MAYIYTKSKFPVDSGDFVVPYGNFSILLTWSLKFSRGKHTYWSTFFRTWISMGRCFHGRTRVSPAAPEDRSRVPGVRLLLELPSHPSNHDSNFCGISSGPGDVEAPPSSLYSPQHCGGVTHILKWNGFLSIMSFSSFFPKSVVSLLINFCLCYLRRPRKIGKHKLMMFFWIGEFL